VLARIPDLEGPPWKTVLSQSEQCPRYQKAVSSFVEDPCSQLTGWLSAWSVWMYLPRVVSRVPPPSSCPYLNEIVQGSELRRDIQHVYHGNSAHLEKWELRPSNYRQSMPLNFMHLSWHSLCCLIEKYITSSGTGSHVKWTQTFCRCFGVHGPFWGRQYVFYWDGGKPLTAIYEVFSPKLEQYLGKIESVW
jgi:hypothetical protein